MKFSLLFKYCPVCGSSHFNQDSEKSKRCESCGFVFYMNASASVAVFIVNANEELLVCTRAKEPHKGTLDLPGGFVDDDETAEDAAAREIKEELDGNVVETKYLFSLPNLYEYSGLTIPTLDMFFKCRLDSLSDLHAADDVERFDFVPVKEIDPALFGLSSIRKAVGMFLSDKR